AARRRGRADRAQAAQARGYRDNHRRRVAGGAAMAGRAAPAQGRAAIFDLRGAGRYRLERAVHARSVQRPRKLGQAAQRRRHPRDLPEDLTRPGLGVAALNRRRRYREVGRDVAAQRVARPRARLGVVAVQLALGPDPHRLVADRARGAAGGEDVVAAGLERLGRRIVGRHLDKMRRELAVAGGLECELLARTQAWKVGEHAGVSLDLPDGSAAVEAHDTYRVAGIHLARLDHLGAGEFRDAERSEVITLAG